MVELGDSLKPATDMFSKGFQNTLSYWWVLIPVFILVTIFIIAFVLRNFKKKKTQWTHKLKVRRVLQNGYLTDPIYHKMRRFPLIKGADVFELEKPLLGSYLIPELDEYTGMNEYSIILDKNNRIYTNKGEIFNPDSSSVYVSAKHAEIDVQLAQLKSDFQNINKVSKRVDWSTIAKYMAFAVISIVVMIVLIVGIQNWSEAQKYKSEEAKAMENVMMSLNDAMKTVESTVNTQKLEIIPMMKEVYDTKNLQSIINRDYLNGTT